MKRIEQIPYGMFEIAEWWRELPVACRVCFMSFLVVAPGVFIGGVRVVQEDCAHCWWLIGVLVALAIGFVYFLILLGGCAVAFCCMRSFWRRVTGSRWRNDADEVFVLLAGVFMRDELGAYGEQQIALDALLVARTLGGTDKRLSGYAAIDILRRFYRVEV